MLGTGDGSLRRGWRTDGEFGTDAVTTGDLDGDGDLDLLVSGYSPFLLLGAGNGRFQYAPEEGVGTFELGEITGDLAVADFKGDSRLGAAGISYCGYDCGLTNVVVALNWTGLPAPPCVVPWVDSYAPAAQLCDAGCRLGRLTYRYSRRVPKGFPIPEEPKIGTVLPAGGRVDVVLSRGRRHLSR